MQVIAGFFGSGALAELPVYGAAFSHYFKKLDQFAKLATSYFIDLAACRYGTDLAALAQKRERQGTG